MFGEWMDSIERLDDFVTDKPTDMEIDGETTDYMDEDLMLLMLREEGTHQEPPAIIEATTELKNWAWEGATHPMEDFGKKIKIIEPITPAKKIKTVEPITHTKNIVSIPIESVSASITILVESICYCYTFLDPLKHKLFNLVIQLSDYLDKLFKSRLTQINHTM